jgi:hypothetical protein
MGWISETSKIMEGQERTKKLLDKWEVKQKGLEDDWRRKNSLIIF